MIKSKIISAFFLIITFHSRAQFIGFAPSEHYFIEYEQGFLYPDFAGMNQNLATYYNNTRAFGDSIRFWGINMHRPDTLFRGLFPVDADVCFRAFKPHFLWLTDSLSLRLTGYLISYNYSRDIFPGSNFLDLLIGGGFEFGRFKMKRNDQYPYGASGRYTNPAFLFHGQGELRFNLLKRSGIMGLTLGIKGSYTYDISNGKWKTKEDNLVPFTFQTKMSGYMILASVGLAFHARENYSNGNDGGNFKINDRMPDR